MHSVYCKKITIFCFSILINCEIINYFTWNQSWENWLELTQELMKTTVIARFIIHITEPFTWFSRFKPVAKLDAKTAQKAKARSVPFGVPFHLPVLLLNHYSIWVNILKSFWTSHFTTISKCFDKGCYLKEKGSFCPHLFWGTQNGNWTDRLRCHLSYCSSCKLN